MKQFLTYKNDPLLRKKNLLLKSKYINPYLIFVRKEDFIGSKSKNQIFQKCIYVHIKNRQLIRFGLEKEQKIFKKLSIYCSNRCNHKKALRRWMKNNIYPLIFLRVISKNLDEFINLVNHADYFTDFLNKSRFRINLNYKSLFNDKLFYIVGCSMGDGYISKDGRRWTLVDGTSYKNELKYSKKFVYKLSKIIKKYLNDTYIDVIGNKYVLTINNKPFCRFLNTIFELPCGNKNNRLKVPKIIKNNKLEPYLWRGLFDTDGSVSSYLFTFSSNNKDLISDCYKFLNRNGIVGKINKISDHIIISSRYFDLFKNIGLSHPRKQKEFLDLMERDCTSYKTITNNKFLRMIKLDDDGYRIRLCKKEFRKQGFNENQVKDIFKNRYGITPKQNKNNLIYLKSKKLFYIFKKNIKLERLRNKISSEERIMLAKEWNKIWI